MDGHPVLMLAFDDIFDIIDLPALSSGHYFIIDGYQTRRDVILEHNYIMGFDNLTPYEEWLRYLYIAPPISHI